MSRTSTSIAKITLPKISGVVRRERLFTLLDEAARKPLVWINAPPGSGKTTLAADWIESRKPQHVWYQVDAGDADPAAFFHYLGLAVQKLRPKENTLPSLTPEYLFDMPTFTRRYFEELCGRLLSDPPEPSGQHRLVIVLDNFQEVSPDSGFVGLLLHALDALPPGATIMIMSLVEPPPQFARLRANNRLAIIGWNEIRFSLEEVRDTVATVRRGRCLEIGCPGPEALFEKTDGWAAGLRLMMEALEPQRGVVRNSSPAEPVCHCVESLAWHENVFSYFAGQVMARTDPPLRDFLLATSFLPSLTPADAIRLTGRDDAAAILSSLSRRHYFTDWYSAPAPVYQYHPLFREFLQVLARSSYDHDELLRLRRTAAGILEDAGSPDNALDMYLAINDIKAAESLIMRSAWPLLAQGRNKTVDRWLSSLPDAVLATDPGLLHIAGLSRLTINLRESGLLLEKAYRLFCEKHDHVSALAVSGCILEVLIIEGNSYHEVDSHIDRLDLLMRESSPAMAAAVEQIAGVVLFALAYRNLGHPSLPFWLENAEAAVIKTGNTAHQLRLCNYLMAYYLFKGEFSSVTRIIRFLEPAKKEVETLPPLHLLSLLLEAYHTVYVLAMADEGIELARRGIELGRVSGVRIYEFWFSYLIVCASVSMGNLQAAGECLAGMVERGRGAPPVRSGDLLVLSGAVDTGKEDWSAAAEHFQRAVEIFQQAGALYSAAHYRVHIARALFELGQEKAARKHLLACAREKWAHSGTLRYLGLVTQAYFDLTRGDREGGLAVLREAFNGARAAGLFIAPFWCRRHTSLICAEALDAGIEREFVRDLITRYRLAPPAGPEFRTDAWPWPLKIYTMGRFEILREGKPLRFEGQLQKKPLEALRAIIAFGGREVPEERVMDALWPEADGAAARTVFKAALHRLRQGLGDERFILLKNGRLSLSDEHCWVDVLTLQAAAIPGEDGAPEQGRRVGAILKYYRGPFLPDDEAQEWSTAMRERSRRLFIRLVGITAGGLARAGRFAEAAEQYERAVDVDGLDEDLYRKLMECYGRMGRKDKVAKTFTRCRDALGSRLDIEPSQEAQELYARLMEGKR